MSRFKNEAESIKDEIIGIRRSLHENPEIGYEEFNTSKLIKDFLIKEGITYEEYAKTGVCALIKGNKADNGRVIGVRADIDALPLEDKKKCSYASKIKGKMHGCGHDGHTSILLGIAKLINNNRDIFGGTVKLMFEPAEETTGGAKVMIEEGVLENPKVDAALAMHVHSGTPSNVVLCGLGTSIAGCNRFRIVVKGKGCHGAMPETGIDPINIAAHIYLAIQTILTREISATESAVVTIGKFVGGDAPNVIPEEVVMEGTIRSLDKEVGEFIFDRMNEIVTSTAKMLRGEAELIELSSVPPLANNDELAHELTGYMKDIVGEKAVVLFEQGGMGSEDLASYSYEVPSVYIMLGAGTKQENSLYGEAMHNEKVVFNEDILPTGAAIHAYSAIMWLKNNK